MPIKDSSKRITINILDILKKHSDEDYALTASDIIDRLSLRGIEAERKTVYRNLYALEECGYDICHTNKGAFLGEREFEMPEIRLLIDAVQSAYFITGKKTRQLVDKLGGLCSTHQFKKLKKQIFIDFRTKCTNEEIYYAIDAIDKGINNNKVISFQYLHYNENRKLVPRYEGMRYMVNPYALVWVNNMYYLLANMEKYDNITHFRVDRMRAPEITCIERRPCRELPGFESGLDPAEYIRGRFAMFSGPETRVQLRFASQYKDIMYDRFGTDSMIIKEKDSMMITTKVLTDDAFYSWIFMLGDKVEIVSPENVRKQMAQMIKNIYNKYKD